MNEELTDEEKVIAEKTVRLIARDYGETLKKLGNIENDDRQSNQVARD